MVEGKRMENLICSTVLLFNRGDMELVKMSKKGQLVVPREIRESMGLEPEDKFMAYGEGDVVVFRKIDQPDLQKEFRELVDQTSRIAKKKGITDKVVAKEVERLRKVKRGGG